MCQAARGHKFTAKCPKCNYTSKIPLIPNTGLTNKNSVHSKHCPVHRLELVRVPTSKGRLKAKYLPYQYKIKRRWKVKTNK